MTGLNSATGKGDMAATDVAVGLDEEGELVGDGVETGDVMRRLDMFGKTAVVCVE